MNNKGQINLGLSIIAGIMILLVGITLVNFLMPEVSRAVDSDNLNCASSDINDGVKLTCLVVDVVVPYFIIVIFALAGGFIVLKVLR